jgi:osmotically-inducible protein OsmY
VHNVDSDALAVKSWAKDGRRRASYVARSDEAIRAALQDAMLFDPRADSQGIGISVHAGTVTLRGTVDSIQAKEAAEQVAHATAGVASVRNRIRVDAAPPSDAELEERVEAAMNRSPFLESYEISVEVDDGVLQLKGTVDSYFEKAEADRIATRAKGVKIIKNKLLVDNKGYPLLYEPYVTDLLPYRYEWYRYDPFPSVKPDNIVREEIEEELWWSPFVDADEVDVQVNRGAATLKGTVDSYAEMRAAVENAFEGGAAWVHNQMRVGK